MVRFFSGCVGRSGCRTLIEREKVGVEFFVITMCSVKSIQFFKDRPVISVFRTVGSVIRWVWLLRCPGDVSGRIAVFIGAGVSIIVWYSAEWLRQGVINVVGRYDLLPSRLAPLWSNIVLDSSGDTSVLSVPVLPDMHGGGISAPE